MTHDQAEAMALSDVVVVMNAGRIEQSGPPDVVYRRPTSRFVADFIGRANFLSGEVLAVGEDTIDISVMGVAMTDPGGRGQSGRRHGHGGGATGIVQHRRRRPPAKVKGNTFLGSYVEYELELGMARRTCSRSTATGCRDGLHAPGEDVAWELLPERAYVLPPADAPSPSSVAAAGPAQASADQGSRRWAAYLPDLPASSPRAIQRKALNSCRSPRAA